MHKRRSPRSACGAFRKALSLLIATTMAVTMSMPSPAAIAYAAAAASNEAVPTSNSNTASNSNSETGEDTGDANASNVSEVAPSTGDISSSNDAEPDGPAESSDQEAAIPSKTSSSTDSAPSSKSKEEDPEEAEEEKPVYSAGELSYELDNMYEVVVKYTKAAGVPDGSTLSVSKITDKAEEQYYESKLDDTLELTGDEKRGFTTFLDIKIISPSGKEVKPAVAVEVEINIDEREIATSEEYSASTEEMEHSLSVVHFDSKGNGEKIDSKPLATAEKTSADTPAIVFETDSFSVFSITSIIREIADWITDYMDVKAYGLAGVTASITRQSGIADLDEEHSVMEAYKISSLGTMLWLNFTTPSLTLNKYESLSYYSIKRGAISEQLTDTEDTDQLRFLSLLTNDGFALVKDSGLRQTTLTATPADGQTVSVSGRAPVDATLSVDDVVEAEKSTYKRALAAYDISINDQFGSFQPEKDSPMTVVIENEDLDKFMEKGGTVDVIHISDDGTETTVEATWKDGALTFEADGFSVYVIIDHEGSETIETPRVQFHFLDEEYTEGANGVYSASPFNFRNKANPSTYQWTQILTDGEDLEMITNPPNIIVDNGDGTTSEKFFYGWYVVNLESESGVVYTNGQWAGSVSYTWTENPEKVVAEVPLSITASGDTLSVGDTISWSINGASGTGVLDEEGTAHVYLAPIYENYYFVNFRMASLGDTQSALQSELMTRKLAVLGGDDSATIRIGDVVCQGSDPTHQVFIGWQTEAMSQLPDVSDRYYATVDSSGEEVESPEGAGGYYITLSEADFENMSYDLYPLFAEARWLYFNTGQSGNGSTYIAATYRLNHDEGSGTYYDEAFFNANTSTRSGYDMRGWYAFANMDTNSQITNLTTPEPVNVSYVDSQGEVQSVTFNMTAQELVHHNGSYTIRTPQDNSNIATTTSGGVTYTLKASGGIYYLNFGGTDYKLFGVTNGNLYFYRAMNDLTLCANWESQMVNYTVVYWLENANDSNYSMMYYKTMQGIAGSQTAAATVQPTDTATRDGQTYYPYSEYKLKFAHLSTDQNKSTAGNQSGIQQQEIAGDGSTVVNVYYDRNVYTLRFDIGYSSTSNTGTTTDYVAITPEEAASYSGTVYGYVDGTLVALTPNSSGGYTYEGSTTIPREYTGDYRYQEVTGTTGIQYGVVNGEVVELTYQSTTITEHYLSRYNTAGSVAYTETIYDANSNVVTNPIYPNTYYRSRRARNPLYWLDRSVTTSSWTYNNGAGDYGNNTRYFRANASSGGSEYNYGFVDGAMRSVTYNSSENKWYYDEPEIVSYDGTLYKQETRPGTTTYYVSSITNSTNYNEFLTSNRVNVGNSIPSDFIPCGRYQETAGGTTYTIYYYDITAKYGENILDRYPGTQTAKSNYRFVGWIPQRDSYYWYWASTSIKGTFETISEDLILTGGDKNTAYVSGGRSDADPDDYYGVSLDDPDHQNNTISNTPGITQEFRCRYQSSTNNYLYRAYLQDPETQEYPSTPNFQQIISAGTSSMPDMQTPPSFGGYGDGTGSTDPYESYQINGSQTGNKTAITHSYSGYAIKELTDAGVGNGMIIEFYYIPNDHTIDYKYGSGAESPGSTFGPTVHYRYGQSLANANIYQSQAEAATPTGHEFRGWYTNPDGIGEPFDFNSTMPDGNIVLYAVYSPLWFVMHIDPNGAEIDHINHNDPNSFNRAAIPGERAADAGYNPSQSTYFWLAYDATIGEYSVTRNYVPISDEAASQYEGQIYYYMNHQYSVDLDGDWGINANARNALYMTESEIHSYYTYYASYAAQAGVTVLSEDVWRQYYVSTQKYRICSDRETYKFLGWYQVFNAGEDDEYVDSMPYVFSTPVSGDVTLRAMWRLDGGYKIQYHADYYMEDGTYINGTMPDWFDPKMGALTYADGAATTIYKQPTDIMVNGEHTDEYVFRGFRLVSVHEDSNNHLNFTALEDGVYYQPGDDYTVFASNADVHGTIHLQAVYEEVDTTYRRPDVTNLTLDANGGYLTDGAGTKLEENRNLTTISGWNGIGTVAATAFDPDTGVSLDPDALIEFGDIQSNQAIHLYRYATELTTVGGLGQTALNPAGTNYFAHPQNFFLLGFDDEPDEGDYIATYAADGVISITRNENETLYAVWEPMIYLNFENNTTQTVTFSLAPSQTGSLVLYVLNQVTGLYDRQEIDPSNLTLEPGEAMHLALPYGEEQGLTISGTNDLGVGKRLIWNTSVTDDETGITYTSKDGEDDETTLYDQASYTHTHNGESCVHDLASGSVDSSGNAQFSFDERLLFNSHGMTITFDEDDIGYALVLDDNYPGGGTQEYDYADLVAFDPRSQVLPSTSTRMGYQLLGWAYDKNATTPDYSALLPAGSPWEIADLYDFFRLNPSVEKEYINDGATLQAKLYAVWDINNAASTVYVYKNVPEPGNQNTEFSFEYTMQGTYRASGYSAQNFNESQTFSLTHGEYAVLVSSNRITNAAEIQTIITIYNADGTVKKDASDQDITYTVSWSGTYHSGGGFQNLDLSVTETELPYYDASVTRSAQSTNNFFIYVGDDTTGNVTQADTNTVYWTGTDAGGTVVFTNQRQTHDVVVNKVLHSNTSVAGTFAFSASYTIDGETVELPDAQVTSGTPNTTWLEDIPAGAVLTITEANNGEYETVISAANATDEGPADDYSFTFTVNDDDTITFDNTLKSYPVKFRLYNQYGDPLSGMFSMSSATSSLGNQLYADPNNDGIFYQNNHFWVGEYTLSENIIPTGYIGLTEPVSVSITGDPDQPITTDSDMIYISEDPDVSGGYIVTVYNIVPSVEIQLTKKLDDPLLDQRTFNFTVGYTYELLDPEGHVMLTINKSNTYPIQATHQGTSETILVPGGATVTAAEVLTAELTQTYDVTHEVDDGGEISGASWTETIPIDELEHTVVFTNKRKTVQVTVQKEAPDFPQSDSYHFNAILDKRATGDNKALANWEIASGYTTNLAGYMVPTGGGATGFSLHHGEQIVLTIPYGSCLRVIEDEGAYKTSVALDGGASQDANTIALSATQTRQNHTITFTNSSQGIIAPTDYSANSGPYAVMFVLGLLFAVLAAPPLRGRRKGEGGDRIDE